MIFFSFIINLLLFGYVTRRATMVFFIVAILMYIFTSDKKIKTSNLILLSIIAGILAYQSLLFTTSMRERTFGWIEHDATLKDTLTHNPWDRSFYQLSQNKNIFYIIKIWLNLI